VRILRANASSTGVISLPTNVRRVLDSGDARERGRSLGLECILHQAGGSLRVGWRHARQRFRLRPCVDNVFTILRAVRGPGHRDRRQKDRIPARVAWRF